MSVTFQQEQPSLMTVYAIFCHFLSFIDRCGASGANAIAFSFVKLVGDRIFPSPTSLKTRSLFYSMSKAIAFSFVKLVGDRIFPSHIQFLSPDPGSFLHF